MKSIRLEEEVLNFRIAVPFSHLQTPVMGTLSVLRDFFLSQGYKKRKRRMRIETKEDLSYSVGLCPFSARDIFLQKEENFDLTK